MEEFSLKNYYLNQAKYHGEKGTLLGIIEMEKYFEKAQQYSKISLEQEFVRIKKECLAPMGIICDKKRKTLNGKLSKEKRNALYFELGFLKEKIIEYFQ